MASKKWTAFWKRYEIKTIKRSRTEKNYSPRTDFTSLHKIGVDRAVSNQIYQDSASFGDSLFFNMFSRFFRKDAKMITQWLKAKSISEGFGKLYDIVKSRNMDDITEQFDQLHIVFKYYNKGQSRQFEGDYFGTALGNFDPKSLVFNMNLGDHKATYKQFGMTKLGDDFIYCIRKDGQIGQPVYKFIKLRKEGAKIRIDISMNSNKEYGFTRKALEKWLGVIIDTPQSKKSFKRFEEFLLNGESPNFIMTGVTYYDNNFRLNVSDIYGRPRSVASLLSYKRKLQRLGKKVETVSQFRIYHSKRLFTKPVPVDILSYKSAGVIGAVLFVPNERKLNTEKKELLSRDFQKDFGLKFYHFVTYDDLDAQGIYQVFLEATPQRIENFDLRSKLAMQIYQELLSDKLLSMSAKTEEQTRFCVNTDCANAFKPVWDRVTCSDCGEPLINGKKLVTQEINEERVTEFFVSSYKLANISKLSNRLLKRPIYVARIEDGEDVLELLPLSSSLKAHQLEILKFRYPNLLIATSLDNLQEFEDIQIKAIKLHDLIYDCKKNNSKLITNALAESATEHLAHLRNLCKVAVERISDSDYYKQQNKASKYFGAELYEADCSALMNYVFGNCIWLGAKYRGKSLPDGFTAFPLHDQKQGCFIWDAKFGEGKSLQMGKFSKNKTYITAAKKNKSIINNGGLKGFVFISNKKFPLGFTKKYLPLTKGSRIKVNFLKSEQLQKIAIHFRKHEKLIYNSSLAKGIFLDSMKSLFFTIANGIRVEIIDDVKLDSIISSNKIQFVRLKAGKLLKP